VPGAVALLAGEPGVGKSTLLLDVAAKASSAERPTLYVTGEESAGQVRLRADRIGAIADHLYLAAETDLSAVLGQLDAVKPALLIMDSVQTVASPQVDGAPGGVAQVREVAAALIRASKERGMSTILVGHVTKDGAIAGPRLLEHLVDVVLHFEGDRHARLRLVRGVKNRYGATDEVGCFELHDAGITSLADPSGLFLTRRAEPVPGTCLTVALEGRRPLVTEVQSLTVDSQIPSPRRTTSGLETSRVSMMLAVLEQRGRIPALGKNDIYTATVGGVRLTEPAADLAVALALGVLGLLTRQILDEAIGAEDLNKVHLMEAAIASNATLQGSFTQIERLAYRLLDWGDFRVYRVSGSQISLAYRSTLGRPGRSEPSAALHALRQQVVETREPLVVRDVRHEPRIADSLTHVLTLVIHPIRFGDEILGLFEVEHHKRHAYGSKDLMAMSTLASQMATAIHIAELRRPLVLTVGQIGEQVTALARVADSLRSSAM
jgi:hypothetical protein